MKIKKAKEDMQQKLVGESFEFLDSKKQIQKQTPNPFEEFANEINKKIYLSF